MKTLFPRSISRALIVVSFVFSWIVIAQAQSGRPATPKTDPSSSTRMEIQLPTPVAETPVPLVNGSGIQTLSFTTPDVSFERTLVKGSAFSADAITEHVQMMSDGNRMVRKSTAHIYRDSAGRTRRENEITRRGLTAPDGQPPRLIVINDPVERVNYTIETQTTTARKRQLPPQNVLDRFEKARGDNAPFSVLIPAATAHRREAEGDAAQPLPQPKKEKLPAQTIEGVLTEGTRTSLTIPAGEFDNEQPMTITHEEWYAPELHMIVLMKHNDPRFGETNFRLTNILRSEPDAELFQVPPGYRVVEGNERPMIGPRTPPAKPTP